MFYHAIDPVLVNLGPVEIRYYGVIYALGFVIFYLFLRHAVKKGYLILEEKDVDNLIGWLILGVVGGARLFEVIFYNPGYYLANPLEIIAVWKGGLSFHGGLLGALMVSYIFCKKRKISLLRLLDVAVIPVTIALALGRVANFINGELYGKVTSLPWGVKFQNVEGFRHPSQLYEAAKNLLLLGIAVLSKKYVKKDGQLFGIFLVGYGVFRFGIEFVKEPEVIIASLSMGQWLSIPLIIGGWMLIKKKVVY